MSNVDPSSLQISPDAADPLLAEQQDLFNGLVRDVASWRAALAEWKDRFVRYRQAVEPVRRELLAAWREWVLALDHASLRPGLSRAERKQLGALLQDAVAPLDLQDDPEIAAVAARHADDFSASGARRQEDTDVATGDPGHLADPAEDWEREAAAAAAQRSEWAAKRRAASALRRRRNEEHDVSRSVRDVYRRLASALHPDREADATQRARKTTLMQQANQAYAAQNLLALLELQLQAEQIDLVQRAAVDRRRLQHYVTVLQEQLVDLQCETRRLEGEFREAVGLGAGSGLQPRKADRIIASEAERLRRDLESVRRQTRFVLNAEDLAAWLREQRKAMRG